MKSFLFNLKITIIIESKRKGLDPQIALINIPKGELKTCFMA